MIISIGTEKHLTKVNTLDKNTQQTRIKRKYNKNRT